MDMKRGVRSRRLGGKGMLKTKILRNISLDGMFMTRVRVELSEEPLLISGSRVEVLVQVHPFLRGEEIIA